MRVTSEALFTLTFLPLHSQCALSFCLEALSPSLGHKLECRVKSERVAEDHVCSDLSLEALTPSQGRKLECRVKSGRLAEDHVSSDLSLEALTPSLGRKLECRVKSGRVAEDHADPVLEPRGTRAVSGLSLRPSGARTSVE